MQVMNTKWVHKIERVHVWTEEECVPTATSNENGEIQVGIDCHDTTYEKILDQKILRGDKISHATWPKISPIDGPDQIVRREAIYTIIFKDQTKVRKYNTSKKYEASKFKLKQLWNCRIRKIGWITPLEKVNAEQ